MASARELLSRVLSAGVSRTRLLAGALTLSAAGVGGLVAHEGSVKTVYLDPVGIPTVCVGHTATVTKADVGRKVSEATCQHLLQQDTQYAQKAVRLHVQVPITQPQYDALVSFVFNVGPQAFERSTLLRKLNAGDCWGAGAEFPRWNQARGRVLPGLITRRADERATFELGCE